MCRCSTFIQLNTQLRNRGKGSKCDGQDFLGRVNPQKNIHIYIYKKIKEWRVEELEKEDPLHIFNPDALVTIEFYLYVKEKNGRDKSST